MRIFHYAHSFLLGAALMLPATGGEVTPNDEPRVITRVAEIRALSREEAGRALPVKIRGVVTWGNLSKNGDFLVDDGEQGIYVAHIVASQCIVENEVNPLGSVIEQGALVEIDGVSDPGYAPMIIPKLIRRVGSAPLPAPRHPPMERLLAGNEDSQRIEVEGVVQRVDDPDTSDVAMMKLMVEGHDFQVAFWRGHEINAGLVDARVRVTGIFTTKRNLRSEMVGCSIITMGAGDLQIITPAPVDPFLAPHIELDRLLPFSPDSMPYHRRVIHGVVIFSKPGRFFFLQQGNTGVRVESATSNVTMGDSVEVAGFVETTHTLASIAGGMVRSLGKGSMPAPQAVDVKQILTPKPSYAAAQPDTNDFSGQLVRMRGKLIMTERDEKKCLRSLLLATEGQTYLAIPSGPKSEWSARSEAWVEGAELELTGVCELDFKEETLRRGSLVTITGFNLWLRTPGDVKVLSQPSWWTPARLQLALVWAGLIIGVGVVWIFLLRWLLRRRSERLEEVMRSHRDVELEYDSAQRERLRLAVDLHDGIKQHLAAATFRVDAAAGALPDAPAGAATHLDTAHNTLLRTQTELEECLWGLHAVAEGPPDFVRLLHHVIASNEHWHKDAVLITLKGTPRHLPRDVAGSLLLLFQEACGNAFLHGHATHITVTVSYAAEALDLCVVDDGIGFDPRTVPGSRAGHFGIDGMKQRMRWLGGTLQIHRHSGGIEVHAKLPWSVLRGREMPDPQATRDTTPHESQQSL